ncbi:Uncharacterized phage-encoded protein [uncultured Eubacterium sp.]|nr:Uncharacterized phage-encoded protein [uncultured Eubacterium sp.]
MNQLEQTLDSREVAQMVEKDHNKLLRDIREYCEQLSLSKIGQSDFFTENTYTNDRGKEYPCYMVTKKGCEFIANKLTGVKGTTFTAKYINRFHDMAETIANGFDLSELSPQLQLLISVETEQKRQRKELTQVRTDLQEFKQEMPILGIEESRITTAVRAKGTACLGGKESPAYQDKSLRGKVYSDIYSQLKREFGVSTYKAIRRSRCDAAVNAVERYTLPAILREQIESVNRQVRI